MENEHFRIVEKAIEYIEQNFRNQPTLKDVADYVGLSPFYFQRVFSKWAGISPKKFLKYLTLQSAKRNLEAGDSLLDTTYDQGLSSSSRLHDLFINMEGITPAEYKKKGMNLLIEYGFFDSPFGPFLLGVTKGRICYLSFYTSRMNAFNDLQSNWYNSELLNSENKLQPLADSLFLKGIKKPFYLLAKGTSFQIKVWEALLKIPEGTVTSYDTIASQIDNPMASRAVGSAIGRNSIGFLIPCHRVIKKSGKIGEYRWGSLKKSSILFWESLKKEVEK